MVTRETRGPETGAPGLARLPAIVEAECPPAPADALAAWDAARQRLLTLREKVAAELDGLETVRRLCLEVDVARRVFDATNGKIGRLATEQRITRTDHSRAANLVAANRRDHEQAKSDVAASRAVRPGLLQRLFRTSAWKTWTTAHAPLAEVAARTKRRWSEAERGERQAKVTLARLSVELKTQRSERTVQALKVAELARELDRHRPALGDRIVDAGLFAGDRSETHKTTPWLPDALQRIVSPDVV